MFKVTIKTLEQRQWNWSGAFIVNFEHISELYFCLSTFTLHDRLKDI